MHCRQFIIGSRSILASGLALLFPVLWNFIAALAPCRGQTLVIQRTVPGSPVNPQAPTRPTLSRGAAFGVAGPAIGPRIVPAQTDNGPIRSLCLRLMVHRPLRRRRFHTSRGCPHRHLGAPCGRPLKMGCLQRVVQVGQRPLGAVWRQRLPFNRRCERRRRP